MPSYAQSILNSNLLNLKGWVFDHLAFLLYQHLKGKMQINTKFKDNHWTLEISSFSSECNAGFYTYLSKKQDAYNLNSTLSFFVVQFKIKSEWQNKNYFEILYVALLVEFYTLFWIKLKTK